MQAEALEARVCALWRQLLSTIVFVYIMGKTANGNIGADGVLLLPLVIGCTAFAVWIGASRSLCTLRVQRAVDKIQSTDNEETNRRLGRDRSAESLDVDNGVDVFEYHDITTMSLYFLRGVMVWLLVLLYVFALSVVGLFLYVSTCQSWFWSVCQSLPWYFLPLLCAVALLWTGCFTRCLYRRSTVEAIRTFGEPCRTKTSYLHAWKYLFAGSLLYAALLYASPAPPVWRWALIATHSVRAVKVLVSLHGQALQRGRGRERGGGGCAVGKGVCSPVVILLLREVIHAAQEKK